MKKFMRSIFMMGISLLVLGVGQFNHVSAMQSHSSMGMVKDNAMSSMTYEQHCQMSCMSPAAKKEDIVKNINQKDDDTEPQLPYFIQFAPTKIPDSHRSLEKASSLEPDSKIPIYKLCYVIRR